MQKIVFILFSAICFSAFHPTLVYANNGPKIKLAKKSSKNNKQASSKLSAVNPKLAALTREISPKPAAKENFKKVIENQEEVIVKLNLKEYEKFEENRSLINGLTALQSKYAARLNLVDDSEKLLADVTLLKEIDTWYGTPYRMGGTTTRGVDCSAFSRAIINDVYKIDLPRTAREQYSRVEKIARKDLVQGDLVFFNTRGGVSHVGIYMGNNKFIHSSSSRGVAISDLDEDYWANHYIGAGKFL